MEQQTAPPTSLLHGVDWLVIGYAAGMAMLAGVLSTLRARSAQRVAGKPISPWSDVLTDTLLGGVIGTLAAIGGPLIWPIFKSFAGVSVLAGVGGMLGPRATDWLQDNGIDTLLDWVGTLSGGLAKAVSNRKKKGEASDGQDSTP